jgi:hypothetical protein
MPTATPSGLYTRMHLAGRAGVTGSVSGRIAVDWPLVTSPDGAQAMVLRSVSSVARTLSDSCS